MDDAEKRKVQRSHWTRSAYCGHLTIPSRGSLSCLCQPTRNVLRSCASPRTDMRAESLKYITSSTRHKLQKRMMTIALKFIFGLEVLSSSDSHTQCVSRNVTRQTCSLSRGFRPRPQSSAEVDRHPEATWDISR